VSIGCSQNSGIENVLRNEGSGLLMVSLSESLIKIRNGDGVIKKCKFLNFELLNGNGSVLNAVISSGKSLKILQSEFKNCVILISETGDSSSEYGYGGAIYIEIKDGGSIMIEDEYSTDADTFTFSGCGILRGDGEVGGCGGAIGIYLYDLLDEHGLKFSGMKCSFCI
jgi:hypothetical protein